MSNHRSEGWSRREFLAKATLAGAAGILGLEPSASAAEPPPETTRIRLTQLGGFCSAPQYIAKALLPGEGFTDIQYVAISGDHYPAFASGEIDISMAFTAPFLVQVDAGLPIMLLGGVHVGCYELVGTGGIRAIRDLKGKSVGVPHLGSAHHLFLSSMLAYVGLDPRKDINWVTHDTTESARLLADRKVDALMAYPPVPQELRVKKIGHVIVNSAVDRPWSQYFCCMVASNREFVRKHPVATKRALRAILKATDICALEPERAAQIMADGGDSTSSKPFGFTKDYHRYGLQTMKEIPYDRWREYDPEDSVRFYALNLHDVGMIKTSPNKIIAQGTDWRFIRELKKELKG
jgi:NitT/TauT family transport system substrate-binding protein